MRNPVSRMNVLFSLDFPISDSEIYKWESNGFGDSSWYYVLQYSQSDKIEKINTYKWREKDKVIEKEVLEYIQEDYGIYHEIDKLYEIDFSELYYYEYYQLDNDATFCYIFWFPNIRKMYIMGVDF